MIGEMFNYDDVFIRNLTTSVLDALENEITWVNVFTSGEVIVSVPFYYGINDSRFILDSFNDDIVNNNRFYQLNSDIIPRGVIVLNSTQTISNTIGNQNIKLITNSPTHGKFIDRVKQIPKKYIYDVEIVLKSEIDVWKALEGMDSFLYPYKFVTFDYMGFNIKAYVDIPESSNMKINREKTLLNADAGNISISFQIEVTTMFLSPIKKDAQLAKRSKWFSNIFSRN